MHQLLMECPSIYELMGPRNFNWQVIPRLELFRKHDSDGNSRIILESYTPSDNVGVLKEALATNTINYNGLDLPLPFNSDILKWANETWEILSSAKLPSGVKFYNIYGTNLATSHTVCYGSQDKPVTDLEQLRYFEAKYICVDGDGPVPVESAKADGLNAEARVGIPGEHRGILCEPHLFRIIKHWLRAGDPDPFYDPLNDYVILPTAFEMESHKEKGVEVASLKEEWDVISKDQDEQSNSDDKMEMRSISVSHDGTKAHATVTVREGKQHVELKAVTVSVDA